jgi:hypothetical protein
MMSRARVMQSAKNHRVIDLGAMIVSSIVRTLHELKQYLEEGTDQDTGLRAAAALC